MQLNFIVTETDGIHRTAFPTVYTSIAMLTMKL